MLWLGRLPHREKTVKREASRGRKAESTSQRIKRMAVIALFCAIAYVAMFIFRVKVSFLTFDIKDAIIAICGFVFGPIAALCSSFTVALLEAITVSDTGIYGLIMNFLSSAAFSCTAAFIYKYRRRLSGAILGLIAGVFVTSAVMVSFNILITPLYMHADRAEVVRLIPTLFLPFNLVKSVFNAAITLFLYKPVSIALRASGAVKVSEDGRGFALKQTLMAAGIGLLFICASVAVFIFLLDGSVQWF